MAEDELEYSALGKKFLQACNRVGPQRATHQGCHARHFVLLEFCVARLQGHSPIAITGFEHRKDVDLLAPLDKSGTWDVQWYTFDDACPPPSDLRPSLVQTSGMPIDRVRVWPPERSAPIRPGRAGRAAPPRVPVLPGHGGDASSSHGGSVGVSLR